MSLGANQQGPNTFAQYFILWIAFWDGPIFRGYVSFGEYKVIVFPNFWCWKQVEALTTPNGWTAFFSNRQNSETSHKFLSPQKNGWVPQLGVYWTTDVVAHNDNVLPTGIIRLIEVKLHTIDSLGPSQTLNKTCGNCEGYSKFCLVHGPFIKKNLIYPDFNQVFWQPSNG